MRAPLVALLLPALLAGCLTGGDAEGVFASDACPETPPPVVQEVVVEEMAGGGRVAPGARQEVPLPLPWEHPWSCVRAVEVVITWTNGPDGGADLYVGYEVPPAGLHVVGPDAQQFALDGAHTERVLGPAPLGDDAALLATDLVVVLYTDWASLSANGLPVTVEVHLHTAA